MTTVIPTPDTLIETIVVAIVFIVASARVTRLVIADTLPPIVSFRIWYEDHAPEGWDSLVSCPWCFGFWAVLVNFFAGWAAYALGPVTYTVWFGINFVFAAAYAASWLVHKDED